MIEHDLEVILNADYVIELGPGAGEKGGEIVFVGNPEALKKSPYTHRSVSFRKKKTFPQKTSTEKRLFGDRRSLCP
ncbi:MAG: UvrABC system protein A [Candidatus Methanoperedenaceae archaeon GB37]|nr:UvrABC system protein A [Candidatus Methanoperedenaceae archaeon GB37]CAD7782828.1 MAG: UvrABC system protein A [Candidatus Methanoperedenaceae archaeon GB37]